jgi:hypothetical protein
VKKIPSLFKRDYEGTRLVLPEVVPGCEWVLAGEGVPTLKIDGTSCMVRDCILYRRFDAKKGKTAPTEWEPCEEAPDEKTGHWPGWLPVKAEDHSDRWHREAFEVGSVPRDGTYELIGPKVQGNPYKLDKHHLVAHGERRLNFVPRDFEALRAYFQENEIEGVVWWKNMNDPNCAKVKIKRRDFGFPWPVNKKDSEK